MEESLFEFLERTHLVDLVLLWCAVVLPPVVGIGFWLLRQKPFVRSHMRQAILGVLAPPVVLLLWKSYNGVMNHYGLDSVRGVVVSGVVFAVAAVAVAAAEYGLRKLLERALNETKAK